jgi:hypothetical protein
MATGNLKLLVGERLWARGLWSTLLLVIGLPWVGGVSILDSSYVPPPVADPSVRVLRSNGRSRIVESRKKNLLPLPHSTIKRGC